MTMLTLLIALLNAFTFWTGTLLTRLAPQGTAFGYRVQPTFDRTWVFRPFRRVFLGATPVAFFATLLLMPINPVVGVCIGMLALPLLLWQWFIGRRKVAPFADDDGLLTGSVTAASDNRIFVPPVQLQGFWLSLLAIVLTVSVIAAQWDAIPAEFAVHFDASGEADSWASKSLGGVFGLSVVNFLLLVVLAVAVVPYSRWPIYARTDTSEVGKQATGWVVAAMVTAMGWFTLVLGAGLSLLQLTLVLPSWQTYTTAAIVLLVVVSIGGCIGMIVYVLRGLGQIRVSQPRAIPRADNSHFKGGMFYYNPDDPAVFVDKRDGVGVDLNYARWQAKAYLGGLLALIAGLTFVPVVLL